jgi:catechol-2,3-dioxygenase
MKMAIMRIGRAELRVLDLEESINYYTNIIGLEVVGRSEGRAYLKAWDEYDHHSLVLQEADSPGLDHFAFKVQNETDLEYYERQVEQFGAVRQKGFLREPDLLKEKPFVLRCQQGTKWNFITTFNKWASRQVS